MINDVYRREICKKIKFVVLYDIFVREIECVTNLTSSSYLNLF